MGYTDGAQWTACLSDIENDKRATSLLQLLPGNEVSAKHESTLRSLHTKFEKGMQRIQETASILHWKEFDAKYQEWRQGKNQRERTNTPLPGSSFGMPEKAVRAEGTASSDMESMLNRSDQPAYTPVPMSTSSAHTDQQEELQEVDDEQQRRVKVRAVRESPEFCQNHPSHSDKAFTMYTSAPTQASDRYTSVQLIPPQSGETSKFLAVPRAKCEPSGAGNDPVEEDFCQTALSITSGHLTPNSVRSARGSGCSTPATSVAPSIAYSQAQTRAPSPMTGNNERVSNATSSASETRPFDPIRDV